MTAAPHLSEAITYRYTEGETLVTKMPGEHGDIYTARPIVRLKKLGERALAGGSIEVVTNDSDLTIVDTSLERALDQERRRRILAMLFLTATDEVVHAGSFAAETSVMQAVLPRGESSSPQDDFESLGLHPLDSTGDQEDDSVLLYGLAPDIRLNALELMESYGYRPRAKKGVSKRWQDA